MQLPVGGREGEKADGRWAACRRLGCKRIEALVRLQSPPSAFYLANRRYRVIGLSGHRVIGLSVCGGCVPARLVAWAWSPQLPDWTCIQLISVVVDTHTGGFSLHIDINPAPRNQWFEPVIYGASVNMHVFLRGGEKNSGRGEASLSAGSPGTCRRLPSMPVTPSPRTGTREEAVINLGSDHLRNSGVTFPFPY